MVRVPVVDAAGYLGKSVVREFKKRLLDQDGWEESVRKLSEIPFLAFHYVVNRAKPFLVMIMELFRGSIVETTTENSFHS